MGRVKDLPTGNPSKEAFLLYDSESKEQQRPLLVFRQLQVLLMMYHL